MPPLYCTVYPPPYSWQTLSTHHPLHCRPSLSPSPPGDGDHGKAFFRHLVVGFDISARGTWTKSSCLPLSHSGRGQLTKLVSEGKTMRLADEEASWFLAVPGLKHSTAGNPSWLREPLLAQRTPPGSGNPPGSTCNGFEAYSTCPRHHTVSDFTGTRRQFVATPCWSSTGCRQLSARITSSADQCVFLSAPSWQTDIQPASYCIEKYCSWAKFCILSLTVHFHWERKSWLVGEVTKRDAVCWRMRQHCGPQYNSRHQHHSVSMALRQCQVHKFQRRKGFAPANFICRFQ